ncbi:fidgetin [Raphidocelis subcapitata]|uniref:Fidgetin n=1 Tax=Raphidocelis subcapitata TaxID=307507 RepID=A0A2V0P1N4_9CHLO|nr:fidgetin [Raphidocelis subcapitata]|eukprot:GBF93788.1 fidgetin [Raphidocelis subcapitata]
MQELARHLQLGAEQALKEGRGMAAELQALTLEAALRAEAEAGGDAAAGAGALHFECGALLARADATGEAAQERAACLATAAAAAGFSEGQAMSAPAPTLADALQADVAWRQHLDQARRLRQLVSQATKQLQARLLSAPLASGRPADQQQPQPQHHAQPPAMPLQPPPGQLQPPPQHAPGTASGGACSGGGRQRQIQVPTIAPKPQERKRDADGLAKPAPAGWGAPAAPAPWQPPHPQQQRHPGSSPDVVEISDDEGPPSKPPAGGWQQHQPRQPPAPHQQQQQQQQKGPWQRAGAAPPPGGGEACGGAGQDEGGGGGAGGFKTARLQYAADLRRKGQHQQAASIMQSGPGHAPRTGLTRPRGGGRAGGGGGGMGGGAGGKGFVPPFVSKALDANGAGGAGGGGGGAGEEGPLSARTLEMLGVSCVDELPPELQKCDPKLIEQVCNDVIDASGGISWDDIAGLQTAKDLIREIVVWPMLNPTIFTGPRAPPKGLLLFGPPGTGKTLIGKAVASNISASFFSISASSLTSKWIGEGEKMVRTLFAVAGVLQPSVIFIDEIDSLMSARKSDGEHEASRRLKTEMLVQMEGCDPSSSSRRVLLIGATNRPEELDEAARRRMPKQLYIPLPCGEARRLMVLRQLGPGAAVAAELGDAELAKVVEKTEGYSGSDMRNLIQEACQGPVREAVAAAGGERVAQLRGEDLRPVRLRDFQIAAKAQRASVTPAEIQRYEQYNDRHGAKYVPLGPGGEGSTGMDEEDW